MTTAPLKGDDFRRALIAHINSPPMNAKITTCSVDVRPYNGALTPTGIKFQKEVNDYLGDVSKKPGWYLPGSGFPSCASDAKPYSPFVAVTTPVVTAPPTMPPPVTTVPIIGVPITTPVVIPPTTATISTPVTLPRSTRTTSIEDDSETNTAAPAIGRILSADRRTLFRALYVCAAVLLEKLPHIDKRALAAVDEDDALRGWESSASLRALTAVMREILLKVFKRAVSADVANNPVILLVELKSGLMRHDPTSTYLSAGAISSINAAFEQRYKKIK